MLQSQREHEVIVTAIAHADAAAAADAMRSHIGIVHDSYALHTSPAAEGSR